MQSMSVLAPIYHINKGIQSTYKIYTFKFRATTRNIKDNDTRYVDIAMRAARHIVTGGRGNESDKNRVQEAKKSTRAMIKGVHVGLLLLLSLAILSLIIVLLSILCRLLRLKLCHLLLHGICLLMLLHGVILNSM